MHGQPFQHDCLALGIPERPEADAAAKAFDVFCDELAAEYAQSFPFPPPSPAASDATAAPGASSGDVTPYPAAGVPAAMEFPPAVCASCGGETRLPLLCAGCLDDIEELPDELLCPWYIHDALCAAYVESDGGDLAGTGCGGRLRHCHHAAALRGKV